MTCRSFNFTKINIFFKILDLCVQCAYICAMTKDDRLIIRIDEKLKAKLKKAATADGRTVSNYVIQLIENAVNTKKK